MEELTYEDWKKNPTPRMMWVWDDDEERMEKHKVLYVLSEEEAPVSDYRVIALTIEHNSIVSRYTHCAEIEEPKRRRMTNKELAWWLQEGKHREYKFPDINIQLVRSYFEYDEAVANDEVYGNILIRENGGEWREPLVEVEE